MRWMLRRRALAARARRMASEMLAFQRQRAVNIGESSMAWISVSSTVLLLRKRATLSSSKLCVSPERQHDGVFGGRGLQLEVEGAAEFLAQRQAEGAVDARAERRMDDELHAAGLVEEALEHQGIERG